MDYSAPPQEYPLDLAAFDLSDYVQNSSQELGDIFSGTGPAQQTQHHGQQHQQARDNQQQHATQSRSQQGHHYQSQPPLAQYPAQSQSQQQQQQQQQQPLSDAQQIQQLLGMQLQHQPQQQQQQQQSADLGLASITPAILRERLEQHMKIQQLQQLQAQILQQQIEMLRASQDPTHMPRRDVSYQGLPTPAASSELLPTMQNDVLSMSPIVLQGMLMNSATASSSGNLPDNMMPRMDLQNIQQHLTMSAPPSLAFQQTSPAITDYELSPLTSPWLSGTPGVPAGPSQHQTPTLQHAKRTRRNSDADDNGARKRQNATGTRPMVVAAPSPPKRRTPPMRTVAHRRSSLANETMLPTSGEPSHQMLPPPPKDHASSSSSPSGEPSKGFAGSPDIAPVTPGAIMGLGPMRSGLVPPVTESGRPRRNTTKSRTQPEVGSSRKTSTTPLMGPSTPRTILPSGGTPILAPLTQGQPQVRKSSHKVAEQRRRDSMKLSYDDLRLLLPPIPVAADDAARDEPLLPGAMPPRGPPRGDGDGPNRAVSKLALLRSGNEYIRELKWKMDRRDEEVGRLRDEVGRLRRLFDKMGVRDEEEGMEPIDLTRDLDEGWEEVRRARRAAVRAAMGDDEYDDDD